MEKLRMQSINKVDENVAKIEKIFPNCVTEANDENGKIIKAIDFDMLKQEFYGYVVEGREERYQFTWPDKKKATLAANAPIYKTLRPCKDESEYFDSTENLYIEGDNLDVLKLLQETYLGKIKMVYIDPPYNTGNDFIYEDNYALNRDDYKWNSGQFNDEGYRVFKNLDSNGRYHTDWLNMMYPRLKLSKELLSDDGIILISIDDNEVDRLGMLCDEIFGSHNFVSKFIVTSNSAKNNAKYVSTGHEYILCYARSKSELGVSWKVKKNNVDEYRKRTNQLLKKGLSTQEIHSELLELVKYPRFYDFDHYTYVDKKGIYRTDNPGGVKNGNFETQIIHPVTNKPCSLPNGGWRYKDEEIKRMLNEDFFAFGEDETVIPAPKRYLEDYIYQVPKSVMFYDSQSSTKWMKKNKLPFDFPKPVELIKHLISMFPDDDYTILDFFSGSGTTAHSMLKQNAEDGGKRKYILVQIPEVIDNGMNSQFKTLADIGKKRIKAAANEIINQVGDIEDLDIGYRVLKVDTTNMKDVYYRPVDYEINLFDELSDNIKEDREPYDLLFQTMLDLGVLLSSSIEEEIIDGKRVFNVANGFLMACFDQDVKEKTVEVVAKRKPYYFVMRDLSLVDDNMATNFNQIFEMYSPDTIRKVL